MSVVRTTRIFCALFTLSLITLAPSALAQDKKIADDSLAQVFITTDMITLNTDEGFAGFTLKVKGADGTYFEQRFDGAEVPFMETFDLDGNLLADGLYTYELVGIPDIAQDRRFIMEKVRGEDGQTPDLRGLMPERAVQSGYFSIHQGAFVLPQSEETATTRIAEHVIFAKDEVKDGGSSPIDLDGGNRDQVIADDLIVDGSLCVGFDCVNGESFGFDTIRLKENNLRIKFMDTSTAASFPSSDWQITANDSANGGANKFSIDDISGNRTPFTLEANAPSHSLYVDDGGRIGLGTSIPVVELHVIDGDTPTLRLQQDGSSGFQPQTWDVAGNETSFFIRDATNGSALPFRIRPAAPGQSLVIDEDGDIGVGTLSADPGIHVLRNSATNAADLHLEQTNASGTARVHVESANASNADLLRLTNGGGQLQIIFENAANTWTHFLNSNGFAWIQSGDSENAYQMRADGEHRWSSGSAITMTLEADGDLITTGTVNPPSDRNLKQGFETIDPREVLATLAEIPVTTWQYKKDSDGTRHMGPMAQDFYAAFGLGIDNRHISYTDIGGVALAAIKGLNEEDKAKDAKIADLEARLAKMEALLLKLAD